MTTRSRGWVCSTTSGVRARSPLGSAPDSTSGKRSSTSAAGPGYATLDLAELVGAGGRVVAVDRSRRFLDTLDARREARGIEHVTVIESDLDNVAFDPAIGRRRVVPVGARVRSAAARPVDACRGRAQTRRRVRVARVLRLRQLARRSALRAVRGVRHGGHHQLAAQRRRAGHRHSKFRGGSRSSGSRSNRSSRSST